MYFRSSCAILANFDLYNPQETTFYIALHHTYSQDQIVPDDPPPNRIKLCTVSCLYLRPNLKQIALILMGNEPYSWLFTLQIVH